MNFKKVYKVMSVAMLMTCVSQVTYPLASETASYAAKEVENILPKTVYKKEDLLNSQTGDIYRDTIENEKNKTLSYEVKFNEFTNSDAEVTINKKMYNLKDYAGKTVKGETKNSISYSVEGSNINEDVIKSLNVTIQSEVLEKAKDAINSIGEIATKEETPDTGDQLIDSTQTQDTGDQLIDSTQTQDTGDQLIDSTDIEDQEVDGAEELASGVREVTSSNDGAHNGTGPSKSAITGSDEYGITATPVLDGAQSGKNQTALTANDTVVIYKGKGFDICEQKYGATGTGNKDKNDIPQVECMINSAVSTDLMRSAPNPDWSRSFKKNMIDYMNIQARDNSGTSINLDDSNVQIVSTNGYDTDFPKFGAVTDEDQENPNNKNTDATNDNFSDDIDKNENLTSLQTRGYATYNFDITVDGVTVKSSMTVVNPFYIENSAYFETEFKDEGYTKDTFENHLFGSKWQTEESSITSDLISAGISLDMVLDVQYDQTVGKTITPNPGTPYDADDLGVTNEASIDAVTDAGEQSYTLGFDFGKSLSELNDVDNADKISGYQLNIPRGSDDEADFKIDTEFLGKYFNKFELTTGKGADSEYTKGSSNSNGNHENVGYAGKAYDNNIDTYSYSKSSFCVKEHYEPQSHNTHHYGYKLTRTQVSDEQCAETFNEMNKESGTNYNSDNDINDPNPLKLTGSGASDANGSYGSFDHCSTSVIYPNHDCDTFNNVTGGQSGKAHNGYYWSGDVGGFNTGDIDGTQSVNNIAPYYGMRKMSPDASDKAAGYQVDVLPNNEQNNETKADELASGLTTLLKDDLTTTEDLETPGAGVFVVDDGDYDNEVPGTYNIILGYNTLETDATDTDIKTDESTCNSGIGSCTAMEKIGNETVYMILPVYVYEPPRIAADDTEVWEAFAPKSKADVIDLMDVEALWLKALTEEDANEYNENHACEEATGPADLGGETCNETDIDKQHYVNKMLDEVKVTSKPEYDYANPQVGNYLFTFYIDAPGGTNDELDERDIQRQAVLFVKEDWEIIHNADLHGTTPVAAKPGTSWYDLLEKMDLALVEGENGTIEYGNQDIHPEDITIREYGGWTNSELDPGSGQGAIMVLEAVYNGLEIEGIFEVQSTWNDEPYYSSDEISMDVITPLMFPVSGNFDPLISPNPHAYDKNGSEKDVDIDVDFNMLSAPNITGERSLQAGIVGHKLIAGNYEAQNYKVIDVTLVEVDDQDMVKIAVNDGNLRSNETAKDEDDLKDLMQVKALNAADEDITDQVKVFNTGDYEYGDNKLNGNPYTITFGVTDDITGITYTDTADYYVIGNHEPVPEVTLKGTAPVYVHTGDNVSEDDVLELLNGVIELDINNKFADLFDQDLKIVNADGYDANSEDTYHVEVAGVYDEPKSDIDKLEAEAIFEVVVDDEVETSSQITFNGVEDIHIEKGEDFDPLINVEATSKTDGDITSDIMVKTNNVNSEKDGVYDVSYYVSDSTGSYALSERKVAVGNASLDDVEDKDDRETNNNNNGNSNDNNNNRNTTDKDDVLTKVEDNDNTLSNTATTNSFMLVSVVTLLTLSFVVLNKKVN